MLRRVVVENYKIFKTKQVVDFRRDETSPSKTSQRSTNNLFAFVGENVCGKSTLLNLIGLAGNFGCVEPIRSLRVCESTREAKVVCEYHLESWAKFSCLDGSRLANTYPEFKLWFLNGILEIPKELHQLLQSRMKKSTPKTSTSFLTLIVGFKKIPVPPSSNKAISKFLFLKYGDQIFTVIQPFDEKARVGVFPSSSIPGDIFEWYPTDLSSLESTKDDFLRNDCTDLGASPPAKVQKTDHSNQEALIWHLRNTFPVESCEALWEKTIDLFHQLTGDPKITVCYKPESQTIIMKETQEGVSHEKYELPEGFFYAFVIAYLLVNSLTETVLLDEPTRGMHPLQIPRLARILSHKSSAKKKVILVTSHAPDMLHGSPIDQIFRFQRYSSGYSDIRCVPSMQDSKETRFIGSAEVRELFFTRRIIWVEGYWDLRFCEAMLKLIDEGNKTLWWALQKLLALPAYTEDNLKKCQESVRSCSVFPLSGKGNIYKAVKICKDLDVPYRAIMDLDAILPFTKDYLKRQFKTCNGDWNIFSVEVEKLSKTEAGSCVKNDPALKANLQLCGNANKVMEFYEKNVGIFTWRVGGSVIEDVVGITKSNFEKKEWQDFSFDSFQKLIEEMLNPRRPNLELLRCITFILQFLQNNC